MQDNTKNRTCVVIPPLATGQAICYDASGAPIPCPETGQEGEYTNDIIWPEPRFALHNDVVLDQLTGLYWTRNANLPVFPMNWQESFNFINQMNQENALGYSGWRLPNRRELRSLMSYQTRLPALPDGLRFVMFFLAGTGARQRLLLILNMPGMYIWKAPVCFMAAKTNPILSGPFEVKAMYCCKLASLIVMAPAGYF